MSTKMLWIAEMLEQLPDDSFQHELDDRELIKTSPGNLPHGQVVRIFRQQGSDCIAAKARTSYS